MAQQMSIQQALETQAGARPDVMADVLTLLMSPDYDFHADEPACDAFMILDESDLVRGGLSVRARKLVKQTQDYIQAEKGAAPGNPRSLHKSLGCLMSPSRYFERHRPLAATRAQLSKNCPNEADEAQFEAFWGKKQRELRAMLHNLQGKVCAPEPDTEAYEVFKEAVERLGAIVFEPAKLAAYVFVEGLASDGTKPDVFVAILPEGMNIQPTDMYSAQYAFCVELIAGTSWNQKQKHKLARLLDRFHRMLLAHGQAETCTLVGIAGDGRNVRPLVMTGAREGYLESFDLEWTSGSHDLAGSSRRTRRDTWTWDVDSIAVREIVFLLWLIATRATRTAAAAEACDATLRPGDMIKVDGIGTFGVLEAVRSSEAGGVFRCSSLAGPPDQQAVDLKHDAPPASMRASDHLCITRPSALQAEISTAVASRLGKTAKNFGLLGGGRVAEVWRKSTALSSGLVGTTAFASKDMGTRVLDISTALRGDAAAADGLIMDILPQLAALKDAGIYHGDIHPGNITRGGDGHFHLIDFGLAVGGSTCDVYQSHGLCFPLDFTPGENAIAASLLFGSYAAISGQPLHLPDEVESLLYSGAYMFGSLLPWHAAAAAEQVSGCLFQRSELRRVAADAATLADIAAWVAELPQSLQKVLLWAMKRKSAAAEDLLDLHSALQDEDLKDTPFTAPVLAEARKRRLSP